VEMAVLARGAVLHGVRDRLVAGDCYLVPRSWVEAGLRDSAVDEAAAFGEALRTGRYGEDLRVHG
jgi:hypothetical protein